MAHPGPRVLLTRSVCHRGVAKTKAERSAFAHTGAWEPTPTVVRFRLGSHPADIPSAHGPTPAAAQRTRRQFPLSRNPFPAIACVLGAGVGRLDDPRRLYLRPAARGTCAAHQGDAELPREAGQQLPQPRPPGVGRGRGLRHRPAPAPHRTARPRRPGRAGRDLRAPGVVAAGSPLPAVGDVGDRGRRRHRRPQGRQVGGADQGPPRRGRRRDRSEPDVAAVFHRARRPAAGPGRGSRRHQPAAHRDRWPGPVRHPAAAPGHQRPAGDGVHRVRHRAARRRRPHHGRSVRGPADPVQRQRHRPPQCGLRPARPRGHQEGQEPLRRQGQRRGHGAGVRRAAALPARARRTAGVLAGGDDPGVGARPLRPPRPQPGLRHVLQAGDPDRGPRQATDVHRRGQHRPPRSTVRPSGRRCCRTGASSPGRPSSGSRCGCTPEAG